MAEGKKKVIIVARDFRSAFPPDELLEAAKTVDVVDPKCTLRVNVDGPRNREERRKAKRGQRKRGR